VAYLEYLAKLSEFDLDKEIAELARAPEDWVKA